MKVNGVEPNTGNEVEIEIERPGKGFFEAMADFDMSDESIRRMIDNLNISADAKSLLYSFSKATIRVGEHIIKIGRKILDAVCHTFKQFPNTTFGMVFGAIAGILISSIPILGQLLGPIVTPIFVALGAGIGRWEDFQDKMLERKIALKVAEFAPLAESNPS